MAEGNKEADIFARLKYEGELVTDGFMDARKAGEVLLNLDEALRYFLYQESEALSRSKFEIPVKVQEGSWETVFLENFDTILLKAAATWGASKYLGSALSEMAKNDFKDMGFKAVFKNAFKAMTWVFKIALHLGTLQKRKFEKLAFSNDGQFAFLENEKGEILQIPAEYLEKFSKCPSNLFIKIAQIIEVERELVLEFEDKQENDRQFVRVSRDQKGIFIPEDEDEVLFPELVHDAYIELEGHITRGNENSNTVGFMYQEHILTSYPRAGNIKNFKNCLFTNCVIKGFVDRLNKSTGEINEKRPRIKFVEIVSNERESKQAKLF